MKSEDTSRWNRQVARGMACLVALSMAACGDSGTQADPDATPDASPLPSDITQPDGDAPDPNVPDVPPTPAEPESLRVVFTRQAAAPGPGMPGYTQVMFTDETCSPSHAQLCDPGACTLEEIAPPSDVDRLCNQGCFLTENLDWIVYFDAQQTRTLRKVRLDANLQVSGSSTIIASEILDVSVGGSVVAYRTSSEIRTHDLDSGADNAIGPTYSNGGLYVAPDGSRLFIKRVTSLTSMDITTSPVTGGGETVLLTISDNGPQNAAGSLLRGSEPLALSPDGSRLAILTQVRNASNRCSTPADCVEPGYLCPSDVSAGRCYQHQLALSIINVAQADRLGQACTSDDVCGDDHTCDLTAPDASAMGSCIPKRFVLGATGQNACGILSLGEYDSFRAGMGWIGDREVVAPLVNGCDRSGDITVTDIVSVDIDSGALRRLVENPGSAHGGPGCFDAVEQCYKPDACAIEISQISISPERRTIAFVASSYTSASSTELWLVNTDGVVSKTPMTRDITFNVRNVSLHRR